MANATPQQMQQMQRMMQQQQLAQQAQQQQQLQQQQQHQAASQNAMMNGVHPSTGPGMALPNGMNSMNTAQAQAMMKAMAMHQQQQQQQQHHPGGMSLGGGPSGLQPPQQPTMVAKMMPTQTPAQMAQAAMGKGKAGPKKGATAKKGPPPR